MNRVYQQGWNDAIDAIVDNAPTVKLDESVIQSVLNKRCMTIVTNEHLRALYDIRPHGKWIVDKEHSITMTFYKCTNCNYFGGATHYRYCPNCGADMRGAEND